MEADEATALDWAPWMKQRLCQHVAQHGDQQWNKPAYELMCPVRLLELKWNVLLIQEGRKRRVNDAAQQPVWTAGGWELGVLRRVIDALKESPLSMRKKYKIVASWLPGRTNDAVKHAWKSHLENKTLVPDGFPETVLGTLMAWPGVQSHHTEYLQLPARQIADDILQLLITTPEPKPAAGSQTLGLKRKRAIEAEEEDIHQEETEQAAAVMSTPILADLDTNLGAGAATAGGPPDSVWLPLGRYSPGLSSSSSVGSSGGATPRMPTVPVQSLAAVQQLLPQTPLTAPIVLSERQSCNSSSSSNSSADDLGSSRSTNTAVATACRGFNSLVEQLNASQNYQTQLQPQAEHNAAPRKRKRSRLSQSTNSQQCMQQGSTAAASGAGSETVSGHGLGAYNMVGHNTFGNQPSVSEALMSSNDYSASGITTAAAEAAVEPRPLIPACWVSLDSTAAGQLAYGQFTAVSGWSSAWYDVEQQLQAAAAAADSCGPAPACYSATYSHAWPPGSAVAALGSQQLQLSSLPQQLDSLNSLVSGTAGRVSSGGAAAGSGGALTAAACETAGAQPPVYTTSEWLSLQQVQQAQLLACMDCYSPAAAVFVPGCPQAANGHVAQPFLDMAVDILPAASEAGVWPQQEQGGYMTGLLLSHQGSASAGPVANLDDPDLDVSPGMIELQAEMIVEDDDGWLPMGQLVFDDNSDMVSEELLGYDLSDLDSVLGLADLVEMTPEDLIVEGC